MSGLNAGGSYRPLIVEMALSTPNFLTCSLWAVNTVIAKERLLLWRSRTRPTRATFGWGVDPPVEFSVVMAQTKAAARADKGITGAPAPPNPNAPG